LTSKKNQKIRGELEESRGIIASRIERNGDENS
jgi:hypothetical protein